MLLGYKSPAVLLTCAQYNNFSDYRIGVYGKIFVGFQFHEFLISKKISTKKNKIYVVHTLFLTDS